MTSKEDFGKAMLKLSPQQWVESENTVGEGIFRVGRRRDMKWETAGGERSPRGEIRVVLIGGNVSVPQASQRGMCFLGVSLITAECAVLTLQLITGQYFGTASKILFRPVIGILSTSHRGRRQRLQSFPVRPDKF